MSFFSKELTLKAVIKNTIFGVKVLVGEWQWLYLCAKNQFEIAKLEKRLKNCEQSTQIALIKLEIQDLKSNLETFRKLQVQHRLQEMSN